MKFGSCLLAADRSPYLEERLFVAIIGDDEDSRENSFVFAAASSILVWFQ